MTGKRKYEHVGNWKRWAICSWRGHENIGTRDLLYGGDEVTCLRCWGRAGYWPATPFRGHQ